MNFSKKIIANISILIIGTGIGFSSLTTGNAIAQISQPVNQNSPETTQNLSSLKNTSWQLITWGESQPLAEKPITLSFKDNNQLAGSSGCNRYMGTFEAKNNKFSLKSPLGSTMMACPEDLMKQEQQFLKALTAAKSYKINAQGELEIQYGDGQQNNVLKFSPAKTSKTKYN